MGYRISTINNLPENLGCYFFLVGDYRNSSMVNDLFREGFNIIADRLGQNNAVIQNTEKGHLEWDLAKALHDVVTSKSELADYIREFESRVPGLLIMWKHPKRLTNRDAIVHIPFQVLDETYTNSTELLLDLVSFAKNENENLISKIKAHHKIIKGLSYSLNLGVFAINIDL